MKILKEIIDPNTVSLTNTQQAVLVIINLSPTPEVAFENTNGTEQSVYARSSLRTLGLVLVGNNKTALTDSGRNIIKNYNLVDETGQLTDRAVQILDNYKNQSSHSKQDIDINDNQLGENISTVRWVIEDLQRPGNFYNSNDNLFHSELSGEYKRYFFKAHAERAATKLIKNGRNVKVVAEPSPKYM